MVLRHFSLGAHKQDSSLPQVLIQGTPQRLSTRTLTHSIRQCLPTRLKGVPKPSRSPRCGRTYSKNFSINVCRSMPKNEALLLNSQRYERFLFIIIICISVSPPFLYFYISLVLCFFFLSLARQTNFEFLPVTQLIFKYLAPLLGKSMQGEGDDKDSPSHFHEDSY